MNARRTLTQAAAIVLAGGTMFSLGLTTGCHTNYPAVGGTSQIVTSDNPNGIASEHCATEALRWVLVKYPPNEVGKQDIAINLPPGLRKPYYERIAKEVGPRVHPLTSEIYETNSMPIYHVGRIWIREKEAKVDVLRPMLELGAGPDGKPVYQVVTVHLEGRFQPWRVVFGRSLEPGVVAVPQPYFLPENDDPNQYRTWLRQQKVATGTPSTAANKAAPAAEKTRQVTDANAATPTDVGVSDAPVPATAPR
jgi:hypothetical protein